MFVLYAFIVSVLLLIISYQYLKIYQLCGYKTKVFLNNILTFSLKIDDKNRLVITKRMLRFIILYFALLFSIFIVCFFFIKVFWLILLDIVIVGLFLPMIIIFAHILMLPIEKLIQKYYIKKTRQKLLRFKGKKIAIVGSFGKTSLKNILYSILKDKYKVIMTPQSYNTPMGISKTALTILKDDMEIAIFEMGARHEGDIKQLMQIVNPDIGIMTAVGEQHIETFGDLNTVIKTKNELVEDFKGDFLVFDGANENTKELFKKCAKKKFLACDEKGFSYIKNPSYSRFGLCFDMVIDGKTQNVKTKLLGRFNAENILIASTVAYLIGAEIDYIASKIETLSPVKNRLELLDMKDFSIIDDSYNANPVGCEEGLNVLKLFDGEKIVVTSGMVELGALQHEKNFVLGKQIGLVANKVVVMNETNKKAIVEGLKTAKFDLENLFFANTREGQKQILRKIVKKGSVVLFQNDLPDNYK